MRALRTICINVAVLVGTLLAAEIAWRVLVPASEAARVEAEFIERSLSYLQPCVRVVDRDGVPHIVGPNMGPGQDFAYSRRKRPDLVRIAVIGESAAANLGVAMQELLRSTDRAPFEILNCAAAGASLDHLQMQANEVLAYDPDVVVLAFGHNLEFDYPLDRNSLRLLRWRARSRLLTDLTLRFRPREDPPRGDRDALLRRFREWLESYSSVLAERDVGLVVTTVVANLRMPPSFEPRDVVEPDFLAARFAYADQRRDEALERLEALLQREPLPIWSFTYGLWLARRGSHERAYAVLSESVGHERDRAPAALNGLLRDLAAGGRISLLDMEASTRRVSLDELAGWDTMDDQCHVSAARNDALAPLALKIAGEAAGSPVTLDVDSNAIQRREVPTDHQRLMASMNRPPLGRGALAGAALASAFATWLRRNPKIALGALDEYLGGESYLSIEDDAFRALVLEGLAFGCWNGGHTEMAMALNRRARELGSAAAWVQLGLFRLNTGAHGDPSAAFRRALEISPDREDARFFLDAAAARPATRKRPPGPID